MIGSASMSARRPMVLPEADLRPRITPTTPVRPMPVTTSSQPNSRKRSATMPAVRWTSYCSSGFSWKSWRQAAISSERAATRLTMGMRRSALICSPDERSDIRDLCEGSPGYRCAHPGYEGRSALAEHALEDRVDVLEMIAEVELLLDLGVGEILLHFSVVLQELEEVAFAAPDRHGVALHELVGVLAACALLRQRQQHALRMHEAAEAVEVLLHVGRIHQQLVDQACQAHQREVERHGRIGAHHALGGGVRDVAFVPEHDV